MMPGIVFNIIIGMTELRRLRYQLKCLLVESYYTKGCVCLALDYTQFYVMSRSTNNIFVLIKHKPTKCTLSKLIF
jgi:hypothetical protein